MEFHLLLPLPEELALVLLAQLKWLSFREAGKKPKLQDLSCALLSSCKSWSRNAGMGGARAMSNATPLFELSPLLLNISRTYLSDLSHILAASRLPRMNAPSGSKLDFVSSALGFPSLGPAVGGPGPPAG